jgi:hypothetical protein
LVFHLLGLGVSYPSSSPLVVGEPFTILKETYQIKEKREVYFHTKNFMLIDDATQTEIEQELVKNREVETKHDTDENKEETTEVDYSVSDLHGHSDLSNPK